MSAINDKDYYEILGVEKSATQEEIRRAFQQKARKLHPDVNKEPGAEERFKEISEAYAVLSDEQKRARYDSLRSGGFGAGAGMPSDFGGFGTYGGFGGFGGSPFDFGFPFGGASVRTSRSYRPRAGSDIVIELHLSAAEAKAGCKKALRYQRYASCDHCAGKGSMSDAGPTKCPTCGGSGHMHIDLSGIFGVGTFEVNCPECEGTGEVVDSPCPVCAGAGRVLSASECVIEVPANVHDGDEVRITGKGNAGSNNQSTGDVVARICVAEERLSSSQAFGFSILGFATPFIVFSAALQSIFAMSPLIVLMLLLGLFLMFKDGLKLKARWWRQGADAWMRGLSQGFVFALFTVAMYSCSIATLR